MNEIKNKDEILSLKLLLMHNQVMTFSSIKKNFEKLINMNIKYFDDFKDSKFWTSKNQDNKYVLSYTILNNLSNPWIRKILNHKNFDYCSFNDNDNDNENYIFDKLDKNGYIKLEENNFNKNILVSSSNRLNIDIFNFFWKHNLYINFFDNEHYETKKHLLCEYINGQEFNENIFKNSVFCMDVLTIFFNFRDSFSNENDLNKFYKLINSLDNINYNYDLNELISANITNYFLNGSNYFFINFINENKDSLNFYLLLDKINEIVKSVDNFKPNSFYYELIDTITKFKILNQLKDEINVSKTNKRKI